MDADTPAQPNHHTLRELEHRVGELLTRRASRDTNAVLQDRLTFGHRAADMLAAAAGSWGFIYSFAAVLGLWVVLNSVAAVRHWDPYPFILLNLFLSCLAAIQAPVILMSQNRQESRDRIRAENDYEVNVKAEILLEHLTHEVEELKRMLASLGAPTDQSLVRPHFSETPVVSHEKAGTLSRPADPNA